MFSSRLETVRIWENIMKSFTEVYYISGEVSYTFSGEIGNVVFEGKYCIRAKVLDHYHDDSTALSDCSFPGKRP